MAGGGAGDPLTDPRETFEAVVGHLRAWEPGAAGNRRAPQRLQAFLEARLNAGADTVWERDVVERQRGSVAADLAVNGEIGVKLVEEVGPSRASEVGVAVDLLGDRYNYVAVYWLDATPATADSRRSVERSVSAARVGVDGLAFVTAPGATAGTVETGGRPGLRGPVVATAAAVGAVSLAWGAIVSTPGLGRALLLGTAGLFLGTLAVGAFVATR